MEQIRTEICVLGGGPAGSTIARQLSLLGHDVCLLERRAFPRRRLGECTSLGILPVLESLGLKDGLANAWFFRPAELDSSWGDVQSTTSCYVVDRGHFDALLLSSAREAGVRILHPARAHRPRRVDTGWHIAAQTPGGVAEIACRFIVDATGRSGALLSRRAYRSARTVALYGYWRSVSWTGAAIRVEAGPNGWFWGGALPDSTLNAIVFLDPQTVRDRGGESLTQLYCSLLASSTLLGTCLGGTLTTGVMACDASSYIDQRLVDELSIKVGEAACSIDPLSSQGVQTALVSALQGSTVVHTLLRKPANTAAALDFYRTHQEEIVAHHYRLSASYYAEGGVTHDTDFWKVRGRRMEEQENNRLRPVTSALVSRSTPVRQSPRACAVEVPCIRDGFIEPLRALSSPAIARPVAFLGDIEVAALFDIVNEAMPTAEVLRRWSGRIGLDASARVLAWMLRADFLEAAR